MPVHLKLLTRKRLASKQVPTLCLRAADTAAAQAPRLADPKFKHITGAALIHGERHALGVPALAAVPNAA